MGRIYNFLGLTTGCIIHGLDDFERKMAYQADITYGTNNEFGFDYLRDNMKFRLEEMVQRPFNFAIVDEVDSILIDEARTPLIISGPSTDSSELYIAVDKVIPHLEADDYEKDEKVRAVSMTEAGTNKVEQILRDMSLLTEGTLYDIQNISLVHHVNQALRAHTLFQRDKDYIVKDDKVIIIDEFTGRMMEGRRYSEGLHQALEAKEHVTIQRENQTLASITFQNYFRLYPRLAGMTGTAMTEAGEFGEIYGLEVVEMPTNVPVQRKDYDDEVYRTSREKYEAISTLIEECRDAQTAYPGRHRVDRKVGSPVRAAEEEKHSACGPERPLPRAGSSDHLPGRSSRCRNDRHQHGGPRHRHPARRQSGHAPRGGTGECRGPGRTGADHRPASAPRSSATRKSSSRPAACS